MSPSYYTLIISPSEDGYPVTKIEMVDDECDSDRTVFQWSPRPNDAPLLRQVDLESGRLDPIPTATFSISEKGRPMVEWGASSMRQPVEDFLAQSGQNGKILVCGAKQYHWRQMPPLNGKRIFQINDTRNPTIVLVRLTVDGNRDRPGLTLQIIKEIVERRPYGLLYIKIIAAVAFMCWMKDPWVV